MLNIAGLHCRGAMLAVANAKAGKSLLDVGCHIALFGNLFRCPWARVVGCFGACQCHGVEHFAMCREQQFGRGTHPGTGDWSVEHKGEGMRHRLRQLHESVSPHRTCGGLDNHSRQHHLAHFGALQRVDAPVCRVEVLLERCAGLGDGQ